jgi:hypothetical protein
MKVDAKTIILTSIAIYVAAFTLPGAFTEWFNYTSSNAIVAALWFIVPVGVIVAMGLAYLGRQ